jgi:hypothetical protein
MMDYFEVRDRMENLVEIRMLYKEYISFTNRQNNAPAGIVRDKLEPLVPLTVDSLNRANLGSLISRDMPAVIACLARHPFLILRRAGFDLAEAEKSPVLRIYILLFQTTVYFLLLHWAGVTDWIWFDILGY